MPRPSTRNLSEATRDKFSDLIARQTQALTVRERAYHTLLAAQKRRTETIAQLDAEVDDARRELAEADAELVARLGLEQAAELTGTPRTVLAKIAKAART